MGAIFKIELYFSYKLTLAIGHDSAGLPLKDCHRLNFSIRDVIFQNLHPLGMYFWLNKHFFVKNSGKVKNSSFL